MVFEFLKELRSQITEDEFNETLKVATENIKLNRVRFNKVTKGEMFIGICMNSLIVVQSKGR